MKRLVSSVPCSAVPRALALPLVSLLAAAACNDIVGGTDREQARIRVESADVSEVEVVTSLEFTVLPSGQVLLAEADSQTVELPFDDDVILTDSQRLYVSVGPADGGSATVRMRVWIDDQSWFDSERLVGGDDDVTMEFVYRFRRGVP